MQANATAIIGPAEYVENVSMEGTQKILVDSAQGIEYRAVERRYRTGWSAEWRPLRALKAFATFSYISRDELFDSEAEALEFIRRNARAIAAGRM